MVEVSCAHENILETLLGQSNLTEWLLQLMYTL